MDVYNRPSGRERRRPVNYRTLTVPLVNITSAKLADVDEVCSLVNAAYRGHGSRPGWTSEIEFIQGARVDTASLRAMLERGIILLLLRRPNGAKLAGSIAVQAHTDSIWHLSMLAIDPEEQAAGLGRILLCAAEKYAAARGAACTQISVIQLRDSLIAWYERRGYRRTGEIESFPFDDESVGKALRTDLHFVVLEKTCMPCSRPISSSSNPLTA